MKRHTATLETPDGETVTLAVEGASEMFRYPVQYVSGSAAAASVFIDWCPEREPGLPWSRGLPANWKVLEETETGDAPVYYGLPPLRES